MNRNDIDYGMFCEPLNKQLSKYNYKLHKKDEEKYENLLQSIKNLKTYLITEKESDKLINKLHKLIMKELKECV